ncbi:MAG: trypsin-like peptidase domain-containing protein [Anaerolineales bacterium]|jgi:2-alkenal reductase
MRIRYIALASLVLLAAAAACGNLTSSTQTPPPIAQPTHSPAAGETTPTIDQAAPLIAEADLISLYHRANQGVVSILTYSDTGAPLDQDVRIGQGSGFVIDMQGHIVTNQHVVQDATQIEVDFPSGFKAWATLVGTDLDSDLAVLKVDAPEGVLVPLPLGNSDDVQVGEFVVAIGNPFGLSGTMTVGVVSGIGRTLASERQAPGGGTFSAGDMIQTDAAINPGNSGGPLLNMSGEVIGVNRAIRTEAFTVSGDAANSGVGFAIPVNIVSRVVPVLITEGSYDYPWLGVASLSQEVFDLPTLEQLGLPPDSLGAYVTCVTPGGPAEAAGVIGAGPCNQLSISSGGDLIIAIDGNPVRTFNDLLSYLVNHTSVGQEITLTVLRQGEQLDVSVTLAARP